MANGNGQQQTDQPDNVTVMPGVKPIIPTTPSIISIPPQISTTLVWVGVGFILGIWLMSSRDKKRGIF